ncbi:MAG: erythromycin esterase family protein [Acidobacteria bacterium]|nr:erythromycin esterase family protein [Acidobacteriota bacterium]
MITIHFARVVTCLALLLIVTPSMATCRETEQAGPAAVSSWLGEHAVALASVEADNGFADMEPLRRELAGVRIVGLGEATHGTREFFQMKHRLVEFLVREMGFTVLALEVQYHKCLPVNDYVLGVSDTDDPAALVRANLSGIYQTEEVLALVEWMRAHNRTVPPERRVRFAGFDVQLPHRAAAVVAGFFGRVAPAELPAVEALLAETAPKDYAAFWDRYAARPRAHKARLRARLLELAGSLALNEARFVRLTSRAEYDAAVDAARILLQSDEIRSVPPAKQQTEADRRDGHMAETVELLLQREPPGARMILWAHNFHLWTMRPEAPSTKPLRPELERHQLLFNPMGRMLRDVFGDAYYAVGLVFDEGAFQAVAAEAGDESIDPLAFTLGPSPAGSLGRQLADAGLVNAFVALRGAPVEGPVGDWLRSPISIRFAGAAFSARWKEPEYSLRTILREHFDGLVFLRRTTRARPLSGTGD